MSDIQSTLEPLVINNYITLAAITAVVYDYCELIICEHPPFITIAASKLQSSPSQERYLIPFPPVLRVSG